MSSTSDHVVRLLNTGAIQTCMWIMYIMWIRQERTEKTGKSNRNLRGRQRIWMNTAVWLREKIRMVLFENETLNSNTFRVNWKSRLSVIEKKLGVFIRGPGLNVNSPVPGDPEGSGDMETFIRLLERRRWHSVHSQSGSQCRELACLRVEAVDWITRSDGVALGAGDLRWFEVCRTVLVARCLKANGWRM